MQRRQFLGHAAGAALLLPFLGSANALAANMLAANASARAPAPGKLLPVPLKKGDWVGLVSPSSALNDEFDLQLAREVMEALGFKVKTGAHYAQRRGHLAGTDEERAGDINAMFSDPEVRAVIATRGGSGAARLLPLLDYEAIGRNPKALLGYSDITALHNAIHARTGLVTFHGPNGSGSWNGFSGEPAVLAALAGSPYLPDFTGKILFLEDVSEAPYRIDRMLTTLKLMGALDGVAGVIFGECSDCEPGNGYGSLTLAQILDDHLKPLKIPAYRGAMIGHIRQQFIVPVGGLVEMDADAGTFRMLEPVFAA